MLVATQELPVASQEVALRPHHLLDILKLYSKRDEFEPDPERQHDFYKIGNQVLANPNLKIRIIVGADSICTPCNRLSKKMSRLDKRPRRCTDEITDTEGYLLKEDWNNEIDRRLLVILELEEGQIVTPAIFCIKALTALTSGKIAEVWQERPAQETTERAKLIKNGLDRYAERIIVWLSQTTTDQQS